MKYILMISFTLILSLAISATDHRGDNVPAEIVITDTASLEFRRTNKTEVTLLSERQLYIRHVGFAEDDKGF